MLIDLDQQLLHSLQLQLSQKMTILLLIQHGDQQLNSICSINGEQKEFAQLVLLLHLVHQTMKVVVLLTLQTIAIGFQP